jgi:hypothetical protein
MEEEVPPEDSMSLRSTLTTLLGTLSSLRIRTTWAGAAAVGGFMAVSAAGCGGCDGDSVVCDDAGLSCQVCDALGCRPAMGSTSSAGGAGGAGVGGAGVGGGDGGVTGGSGGAGGSAPCNSEEATCPCVAGQCTDGLQCIDGLCIVGCNFTYECGAGAVCANGSCVPDCSTMACPAGYSCAKGACEPDPSNPQCSTAVPCPSGEICSNGFCTNQCTTDAQCAAGEVCNAATQTCIPDPSPKPVCSTSKPCPSPEVCEADGFCHYPCTSEAQCQLIDNRFVACMTVCLTQEEVDPMCSLTVPCPAGKSCISAQCQ